MKITETKDIEPSSAKAVDLIGEKVYIVNVEGSYYGIGNVCMLNFHSSISQIWKMSKFKAGKAASLIRLVKRS